VSPARLRQLAAVAAQLAADIVDVYADLAQVTSSDEGHLVVTEEPRDTVSWIEVLDATPYPIHHVTDVPRRTGLLGTSSPSWY
jgi:hypothetical protein